MRLDKRGRWIAGVVVAAAVLVGGAFAITSTLVDDPASASNEVPVPEPITRAELFEEYATISPADSTATPERIDKVARDICDLLDSGHSTDELITSITPDYGANATRLMRLFVSYGCPKHLDAFK